MDPRMFVGEGIRWLLPLTSPSQVRSSCASSTSSCQQTEPKKIWKKKRKKKLNGTSRTIRQLSSDSSPTCAQMWFAKTRMHNTPRQQQGGCRGSTKQGHQ
eukprot:1628397-Amphidinium_carterae.1